MAEIESALEQIVANFRDEKPVVEEMVALADVVCGRDYLVFLRTVNRFTGDVRKRPMAWPASPPPMVACCGFD